MICYRTFSNGINQEAYPMSHTTPAVPQESDRKRWLALIALCTGFLMIILDQTIVNVALPSIKRDLNFSTVRAGVGDQRVPDRVRRPAAARRTAR